VGTRGADFRCGDKTTCHADGGRHDHTCTHPIDQIAKTKIAKTTISAALAASAAALAMTYAESAKADGAMVTKAPPIPYVGSSDYTWNGFYAGGNLGIAWGQSNWTAGPGLSGTNNLFQTIDTFDEAGSFMTGL
jgi:hypothetical protein